MKKLILLVFFFSSFKLLSQWSVKDPFEQKVFIENKGQYVLKGSFSEKEIVFGARQDGLHYYFAKNAIYVKHIATVKRSEKEIEAEMERLEKKVYNEKEEKEFAYKQVEEFHVMDFMGAGTHTEIESFEKVSQTYNFSISNTQTAIASAWKKLIYKNLYPGIDMEFYFPEDKQGFKYNFIVHPGADASQIKIHYPLAEKIKLAEGNIAVRSSFGDFIEHAPLALQNDEVVACVYSAEKNNSVHFNLGKYNGGQTLIIDPWTTTPGFVGINNAYDVDWDFSGNCYAYGGNTPFQLIKIDAAGTILWTYTTSFASNWYYGDFCVDKNSGSAYIGDGFNGSGAQIIKVNNAGVQMAIYNGNALLQEIWRVNFDMCNSNPVIAGGGTSNPSYTGATLDTNLITINAVNVINSPTGLHDMWGLTLDASGNAYFMTAQTQVGSGGYDNIIYKVPNPVLSPIAWQTQTTYSFVEVASVNYSPGPPNGFNGAAVSDTNLFLYDSYVLTRFNNITGQATGSLSINGSSQNTMTYGGLTSDGCGNLFLGHNNTIKQYDANFNFVTSYTSAGTVFDVNLGNGVLYSCGQGFVSAFAVSLNVCNPCGGGTTTIHNNMDEDEFVIYPNPARDIMQIGFPPSWGQIKVDLYNSVGQKLRSINMNDKNQTFSLAGMPNGVYLVRCTAGMKSIFKKVVKIDP